MILSRHRTLATLRIFGSRTSTTNCTPSHSIHQTRETSILSMKRKTTGKGPPGGKKGKRPRRLRCRRHATRHHRDYSSSKSTEYAPQPPNESFAKNRECRSL